MDEDALIKQYTEIELALLEYYDEWDGCKSGRYVGDDDCIYIISEIRKLERQKTRMVLENPQILQKVW